MQGNIANLLPARSFYNRRHRCLSKRNGQPPARDHKAIAQFSYNPIPFPFTYYRFIIIRIGYGFRFITSVENPAIY